MSGVVRVVIADDQALLLGSFRVLVEAEPGLTAVGTAANGVEAVEVALRQRPNVVLMDVRMPEMDGIEATRHICGSPGGAGVRVLMLTMFNLDSYVFAALRAGASGFLLKDVSPAELLHGIRVVAAGESLLAPAVTRRLITEFCRQPEGPGVTPPELHGLTAREREVLVLVSRGLANAEIAQRLGISTATVKTHLGRLLDKLGARDRVQLVIIAYETGVITPRDRA